MNTLQRKASSEWPIFAKQDSQVVVYVVLLPLLRDYTIATEPSTTFILTLFLHSVIVVGVLKKNTEVNRVT